MDPGGSRESLDRDGDCIMAQQPINVCTSLLITYLTNIWILEKAQASHCRIGVYPFV